MKRRLWVAAVALFAMIEPAAAEMPLPTVSFTAEAKLCLVVDGKDDCSPAAIFYTPARFRAESGVGDTREVGLYDTVKKIATTIDFGEKTFSITPFDPKSEDLSVGFLPTRGDYVRVAEETVSGAPTVKYKISAARDGTRTDGFAWIGADNIVRRMQLTASLPNNVTVLIKFDVTKLVVGPVDPALLDVAIPSDFKKTDQ